MRCAEARSEGFLGCGDLIREEDVVLTLIRKDKAHAGVIGGLVFDYALNDL